MAATAVPTRVTIEFPSITPDVLLLTVCSAETARLVSESVTFSLPRPLIWPAPAA